MPMVRIENAKIGMLIAEDIFSAYGSILVSAGDRLDERTLDKLRMHNVHMFRIIDESDSSSFMSQAAASVNQRVLNRFSHTYENKVDDVKDVFAQISSSETDVPLEETLADVTNDIMDAIGEQKDIFKYIHRMKQTAPSIYTHSINVSILCTLFATLMDYPEDKKNELILAALLHDIGKAELGLDTKTNSINIDQLDPEIQNKYKKHSILSYRILSEKGFSRNICLGVLMHHEAENGTGFPTGAKWNQIHEFAKIIAIANFYDHMTFSGDTRKDINPFAVIELLEKIQFNKFDIPFVSAFLKRIANYYLNEFVELNTEEVAQIAFINQNDLAHPIVKIDNVVLDLSREKDVRITKVI